MYTYIYILLLENKKALSKEKLTRGCHTNKRVDFWSSSVHHSATLLFALEVSVRSLCGLKQPFKPPRRTEVEHPWLLMRSPPYPIPAHVFLFNPWPLKSLPLLFPELLAPKRSLYISYHHLTFRLSEEEEVVCLPSFLWLLSYTV